MSLPPEQFNKWSANWAKNVDPRAYAVPQMTPQEINKMLATMKPPEKEKFAQSYRDAVNNGVLPEPTFGR